MLIFLLFTAAFLYFILDRKIRCSFIPGVLIASLACISLIWECETRYFLRFRFPSALKSLGFGNVLATRILIAAVIFIIVGPAIILLLLFLGRLIGKAIFRSSNNGKKSETLAKALYLTASAISGLCGIYQFIIAVPYLFPNPRTSNSFLRIRRVIGVLGATGISCVIYGILLITVFIVCLILVLAKARMYKNIKSSEPLVPAGAVLPKAKNPMLTIGIILAAVGNVGTWIIALVGVLVWRRVYFFNGYTHTKLLCATCILLMIAGLIFIIIGLTKIPSGNQAKLPVVRLVFGILLIIASFGDLVWLILNALRYIFRIRL